MPQRRLLKNIGTVAPLFAVVLAGVLILSDRAKADDGDSEQSKIDRGFAIAPVPLNLAGKDRRLVGLGSYMVNAQVDCDGWHNDGPATQFISTGNPYFLPSIFSGRQQINPATYLGGGRDFGPLIPGFAHIVSRNLTPEKTGLSEGGNTLSKFAQILRTGVDLDRQHPTCSGAPDANCVPPRFDGALLQFMPWHEFQNMADHDIYEYLSAVP